jgi:hypothetical protein
VQVALTSDGFRESLRYSGPQGGSDSPTGTVMPMGFDDRRKVGRHRCPRLGSDSSLARHGQRVVDSSAGHDRRMPEHPEPQPEPKTARGEGCASTNADRKRGKSATVRPRAIARPVTVACSCVHAGCIGLVTDAGCTLISTSAFCVPTTNARRAFGRRSRLRFLHLSFAALSRLATVSLFA